MRLVFRQGGRFALGTLAGAARLRVLAVFDRSLYLQAGDGTLVCAGSTAIGLGPLNLPCADWPTSFPVGAGDTVAIEGSTARFSAGVSIDWRDAVPWSPPATRWPADAAIAAATSRITDAALLRAPREGLFRIAHAASSRDDRSPIARMARPGLEALAAWLRHTAATGHGPPPLADVVRLLGLGPGLTPSGDDLLGGVLIALHALGNRRAADALRRHIEPAYGERTSVISAAHLACAGHGEGHASLHALLAAVNDADGQAAAFDGLDRIGHCSGWDAAAGVLLALRHAGRATA
jgi:hypothetical protein